MKTLILGAGVTGITTAYYLAKKGYDVSVIDKNEGPGLGASYANGCQLCYSGVRSIKTFPPGHILSPRQQSFIYKHTFKLISS